MNRSIRIQLVSALMCLPLFSGCTSVAQAEPSEYSTNVRAERFSEAELAQLLAPIALYPDTLLTHILIAASYPLEVVEAQRWREKNHKLSDKKLMDKAEKQGWDPSVTALIAFPNVLERMSDDLSWTRDLGDAFLADEEMVLDSIQMLRREADRAGNLDGGDNLVVKRQPTQIIIESPSPEIIYVPYYDPRVVYGYWRWHSYPPVYWAPFPGYAHYHRHFGWHSGVSISFNFYFSSFHWHNRHVIVHHHHHYRRPPEPRYAISHGAQRWHHDPGHRRGVAYRSADVRKRYHVNAPSRIEREHQRRQEVSRHNREFASRDNRSAEVRTRELSHSREQDFKARMTRSENRIQASDHHSRERINSREQINSRERAQQSRERIEPRSEHRQRELQPQRQQQTEPQREQRQQQADRQRERQQEPRTQHQAVEPRQRQAIEPRERAQPQPEHHQPQSRERAQPQRERHQPQSRERVQPQRERQSSHQRERI